MKIKIGHILIFVLMIPTLPLFGKTNGDQQEFQKAIAFEQSGEYAKAESLFVELYMTDPNNYNYYNRYRNILLQQRKFADLMPVLEARLDKRANDKYLRLEYGMLHFAMEDKKGAKNIWSDIMSGQKENMRNAYATAVYQDALEYHVGNEFHVITDMLRSMTQDPKLLINYNFILALRYRNWDHAVNELMHILKTDEKSLSVVRRNIFRYDPLSELYPRAIHALEQSDLPGGIKLLSDIYFHLQEYEKAFEILKDNIADDQILQAMGDLARRFYNQESYDLAVRAADIAESHTAREQADRQSMALLSARSQEQLFYQYGNEENIISYPYVSDFLSIDFLPFDADLSTIIESAYQKYDSLSHFPGPIGEMASLRHAEIAYRVYQDFDGSLNEYSKIAAGKNIIDKTGLITKTSKVMLAKGEYDKALEFVRSAALEYDLMVHEEDQLLPYELYISIISGRRDSIIERTENVLAMLPLDDPAYNDMLAFAAVVKKVMKDSLNYGAWLEAERYLLMNNTASAIDIYENLLEKEGDACSIYGLRYLDCLKTKRDPEAEMTFWTRYFDLLSQSDMGDFFILRYAGFMEKMQKFDIAYEIFEKYLLSYRESMYYENIREYVRKHYSLGAP